MKLYNQIAKEAHAETEIERSKFIAHIKPVKTREEAEEYFAEIRKEYRDATHNVPALVLGDKFQIQWASDDGEPQGTSGAPMVQLLVGEKITNTCVIVTRYFGGIKLGTGGLVRAYTNALKAAISEAGIAEVCEMLMITVRLDYSCLAKLNNQAQKGMFIVDDIRYEEVITATVLCEPSDAETVKKTLSDISSGKEVIVGEERCIREIKG